MTHVQSPELLDLPREILLMILQYLPSRSLVACSLAHPVLRYTMLQEHFLDQHFKSALGLLSVEGGDLSYNSLPTTLPLSTHLWFITHNAACSSSSYCNGDRALVPRDSIFYPLECFRHFLFTWIAQALSSKTGIFETNHKLNLSTSLCQMPGYPEAPEADVFKDVYKLPKFITQPLTTLALVFPDVVSKTILASHCSLHEGKPVNLQNVWYEGFTHQQRTQFDHQYCMEILCDQPNGAFATLSAMLILFAQNKCILWTGSVACFPGCKFEQTRAISILNSASGAKTTKTSCEPVMRAFLSDNPVEEIKNCQWKKQKLFPGLCYQIHQTQRKELISNLIETTRTLSQNMSKVLKLDENVNFKISNVEPNDIFEAVKYNQFRDAFAQLSRLRYSDVVCEDIYSNILLELESLFRQEVLEYLSDTACHEVVCPSCSNKWFLSNSVLADCVHRAKSSSRVPFDLWPYHCLLSALILLQEFATAGESRTVDA